MRVVIMGAPGSGKGTQGLRIAAKLGVPHLSTGEMLRQAAARDDDFGREIAELLKHGRLASDEVAFDLVSRRLAMADARRGWVLDGYPRTLRQAQLLDEAASTNGERVQACVNLHVGEETAVARIVGRGEAAGDAARSDDTEQVAHERFRTFERQTGPAVYFYAEQGVLNVIDGEASVDDVSFAIAEALGLPDLGVPDAA